LSTTARSIRVVALPDLPLKGDIIDWAKAGGTREKLDELLATAPVWRLPTASEQKDKAKRQEDELLDALAKAQGLEYVRQRKEAAKELGVSSADIDKEVKTRRELMAAAPLYGHWIVEPWSEPTDGDSLIRDIVSKLRKHVVMPVESALAIALWVILAWVHEDVATHSPILDITSAEPNSGKTTLLGVVSFLAPRAIASVDISRAALYRAIKKWQPSFVIDEFDDVLAAKGDSDKSELRSVINSGHTRNQGVLRCITDEHTPELFSTFCPKAIGMIGYKMPEATLSRCIAIGLRRRKKDERSVKFLHVDDNELADLRRRLLRWSLDNVEALQRCTPAMPDVFENRLCDNWCMQFAIADLCSGAEDWGDKAREAAVRIERSNDSRTATVRLLAAIKAIREVSGDEVIGSQELCDQLAADQGSDWAEWGRSRKPITQKQLANLLKVHGITPEPVRPKSFGGDRQVRGYHWRQFEDAWARYL
jgi:putative DNA primase/helicase